MEGAGSRQSRASSRYASSPSMPVFNGPVRKWKKQWVSSISNKPNNGNKRNDSPPLLLCRWTPLSANASADEPPRRRFRYTPVVPIEKGNINLENEGRAGTINQSNNNGADIRSDSEALLERPSTTDISKEEAQETSEDQADSNKSPVHSSYT